MNLGLILGVLKEGLSLWNSKEGSKYIDKVIKLEKEYYEELAKQEFDIENPEHLKGSQSRFRSQLTLDQCLLDISIIAENFVKYARQK